MTATTSLKPSGNSRSWRDEVPRVIGGRGWWAGHKREGTAWRPAVDISERSDAYRVTVEIPGISAGEVEITMADGMLTIQGERHAAREAAGEKMHRSERGYGVFRRSLALPSSKVKADKTQACVRDGVLQILVPKAAEAQGIPVRVPVSQGDAVLASGRDVRDV
jgi:HSP20 family protein